MTNQERRHYYRLGVGWQDEMRGNVTEKEEIQREEPNKKCEGVGKEGERIGKKRNEKTG